MPDYPDSYDAYYANRVWQLLPGVYRAKDSDDPNVAGPLQELVTMVCWNDIWTRPGLDRRTRSLVNLGMLTALNRMNEFAAHVRGAITNGCIVTEIQEVILQTTAYCGAPAALESIRVAERVLAELNESRAQVS